MVTDKSNETMRLALEALEKLNNTKSYWWQEVDEGVVVQLGNAETALREALAEQPAPVQGWRMVPVQPTDEMRDVGNVIIKDRGALFAAYRAMLDAAPQPAQQEPVGVKFNEGLWQEREALAEARQQDKGLGACPTSRTNDLEIKPNDRRTEKSNHYLGKDDSRIIQTGRGAEIHTGSAELGAHSSNPEQHEGVNNSSGPSAPARQQNEADDLIRNLGFDPEQFRTEAGFVNHMKLRAAIQHPDEYQAAMQPMYQRLTNCVACGRLNPTEGICNHGSEQPAQQQEPVAVELVGVEEAIKEGDGFWKPCTGCYETNEGYPPTGAFFSTVFKCQMGHGCSECGGLGAIWDDTDYEAMADHMMRDDAAPQPAQQEPTKAAEPVFAFLDTKPNYNMTFHRDGKQVGVLDFNGPEMTFTGDADESAKIFFDIIARSFKERLEQERADEREACHALRQTLPNPYDHCQVSAHAHDMAIVAYGAAIRARGNT